MRVQVVIEETVKTSIWVNEATSIKDAISKVKDIYNNKDVIKNLPKSVGKPQFKIWGIENDLHS